MARTAFVLSALIHLVGILLYPLLVGPPPEGRVDPATLPRPIRGIEVVRITEIVSDDPGPVVDPSPVVEPPDRPEAPAAEVVLEEPGPEPIGPLPTRGRTAAEELRPREGDPRLWQPLSDSVTQVSDEWLARLRIMWIIEELNDSTTRAAAAAAAGQDWTFTDDNGKRWGISAGQLHLGDVTLPLPMFSSRWGTDDYRRAEEDAEILRGALQSATWETLEERARVIRERRERERADSVGAGRN